MERLGTVLTFNEGVTLEEASEALLALKDVVNLGGLTVDWVTDEDGKEHMITRNRVPSDFINEFDDDIGGPVWYCP